MKKIFIFIHLILIYFIIDLSIAGCYDYFVSSFKITNSTKSPVINMQNTEKRNIHNRSYYKVISQRDLFNTEKIIQPVKLPSSKTEDINKLKITDLQLTLMGTITGSGTDTYAVIKKNGNPKQSLYMEGDTIDKAIIKTILRGKVILIVDGKKQVLLMKEISSKGKNGQSFANKQMISSAWGDSVQANGFVNNISLKWTDINKLEKNIAELRKQVKIRPHFFKNHMDGFRVYGIKNTPLFKEIGLKNGDIISTVNNNKIRSVKDAMMFYSELNKLKGNNISLNIGIKRRGQQGTLKYSIQ